VESIVMSFPLQARLKSDRINNFRVYALAGVKFDYDLASNSGATNSEDFIKVKKTDYGVEMGVGFQFFFKYFIFSPELKVSQGLTNVHIPDQANKYSDVIDQMKSRMIMFSLQFEGGGSN
jgi:Outer membrane protein beta-barrel domain